MGYGDDYWGLYRDYCRDPFPHSLLSIKHWTGTPKAALTAPWQGEYTDWGNKNFLQQKARQEWGEYRAALGGFNT